MDNNNNNKRTELAKKIADRTNKVSSNFSVMENTFIRFFRIISTFIDNFMFSPKYMGLASLLLALILYFLLGFQDNSIISSLTSSKTVNSVNINARYNSESFEISGVPTGCDVIVTGDSASVSNATANKNGYCLIDLEGYTEGTHFVKVNAIGYGDNVTATAVPSNAQVTLKRKTTAQFQLSYDFINTNELDSKLILGTPEFENGADYVNIRASQDTLNTISLVKALIDVKGQTEDFTVDAPLVAYNSRGQQVNAEIVPSSVKVSVPLSSHSKTVPITLKVTGEVPTGFAVGSIDVDQQSTIIYGLPEAIDKIETIYVELDLSTITSNTTLLQPVTIPTGVSSSSVTVANIKVVLDTAVEKVIDGVVLSYGNNNNALIVSGIDTTYVSVIVKGSSKVIEGITAENIKAYIDLDGLETGDYDLPIHLEKKNTTAYFSLSCEPQTVHVSLVSTNQ